MDNFYRTPKGLADYDKGKQADWRFEFLMNTLVAVYTGSNEYWKRNIRAMLRQIIVDVKSERWG